MSPKTLCTPLIRITLGTWGIVATYAVLHDQYIVAIAPEHFTVGHPPVPGVSDPRLQAAILAANASFLPGMAFGLLLAMAAVEGPWRPVAVRTALRRALAAVITTEIVAASIGIASYLGAWRVYGARWYAPEFSTILIAAQSIQLTAYLCGAATAAIAIGWTGVRRVRAHRTPRATRE